MALRECDCMDDDVGVVDTMAAMNQAERQAMIERLQADNARGLASQAERRRWREEMGIFEDIVPPQQHFVRKAHVNEPTQQRQARDWSAWDAWCQGHIRKAFEVNGVILVDEILDFVHKELAKRDAEIASVRADLTIATGSKIRDIKTHPA